MSFERLIDRRRSDSLKWQKYQDADVLPLWVADMDFAIPWEVTKALRARLEHDIFGYGVLSQSTKQTLCRWLHQRWQVEATPSQLVTLPAVVPGLNFAIEAMACSDIGFFSPIYPPIRQVAQNLDIRGRALEMPLEQGRYRMPLEAIEQAAREGMQALLLCNPHNPGGTIWHARELEALLALSRQYDLLLVSDEIHGDLIMPGNRHHSLSALATEEDAVITLISAGKSFNLAGLPIAFALAKQGEIRRRLKAQLTGRCATHNVLAAVAMEAAFGRCAPWLDELRQYLGQNWGRIEARLGGVDGIRLMKPEATYLAWIDCRGLGWEEEPSKVFTRFGVGLSCGTEFGAPGFVRLNFACPEQTLNQALERMVRALTDHGKRVAG
ncbi:putative C-S lyase [Ferrimonas sediminicola]|uniref:cysteine-S-conjugate beta-lyase n=1 Tax=Ferrimonas sediminicola TaxID=2569538 RepID=A0A4V6WMN1_9GAMM|nr:PatB family C-S lyase [Ferrimonas sediminicola]TKB48463.1 putative C-S lyase [Ferrimonas sediminicola]